MACLRCHSSETIVPNVEVVTYPELGSSAKSVDLVYDQKPDALMFKERLYMAMRANVCCTCGHVELVVNRNDCPGLWNAYQVRRGQ
jgi:hypothetical protein